MDFQITDDVRLVGGERQWELQKLGARKGKPEWRSFQYYSSFEAAFKAMANYDLRIAADWPDFERRLARLQDVAESIDTGLSVAIRSRAA